MIKVFTYQANLNNVTQFTHKITLKKHRLVQNFWISITDLYDHKVTIEKQIQMFFLSLLYC